MIHNRLSENRWLLPAIISTIVTVIVLAGGNCTYESNDDMAMIRLLTGQQGIAATPDAVFLSLPLSALLHQLYKMQGNLPWYGILMYSLLFTGCISGGRVISRADAAGGGKIICYLVFLACYSYLIFRLNFTSVSLFLWITSAAALAADNLDNTPVSARSWLYGTLIGISYLVRPDILLLSLGFSIPLAATCLMAGNRLNRTLAFVTPLLISIIFASGASMLFRNSSEYKAFTAFNKIRSEYTDTSKSALNSQTGRAILATGWTAPDYLMSRNWWLHDGTIFSAEKLSTFMKNNSSSPTSLASTAMLKMAIEENIPLLAMILSALSPVLLLKANNEIFSGKKSIILAASFSITVISIIAMMAIRFPPRIAIPLFIHLLLTGTLFLPHITGGLIRSAASRTGITLCTLLVTLFLIFFSGSALHRKTTQLKRISQYTTESIAMIRQKNGSDSILLCANVGNENALFNVEAASPLKEYRDIPDFVNFPIGWMIASPPYNSFLRDHGFVDRAQAVSEMIDNRKLVLAYWYQDQTFEEYEERFLIHLNDNYGAKFPGRKILLEPVLDRRHIISDFGWVFFRIITAPKTGS